MSEYPNHYNEDRTMAWSCIDTTDVVFSMQDKELDPEGIWEGYVEGLKCLGIRGWLHELAIFNDCEVKMWHYPGLLRERVIYKFSGKRSNLTRIKDIIENQIKD